MKVLTLFIFSFISTCSFAFSECTNHYHDLLKNNDDTSYECIKISDSQDFVSTAQSSNENDYETPLELYLIENNKVISHITSKKIIESDGIAFNGLTLEKVNYGGKGQTIIGLDISHGHSGGMSYYEQTLNLYEIKNNHIQEILVTFPLSIAIYNPPSYSDDCLENPAGSEVKNIFILSSQKHFDHADLIVKSNKLSVESNSKRCAPIQKTQKSQTILKFDGKRYVGNTNTLLQADGI